MKKDYKFIFEGKHLFIIREDNVELEIQLNNEKELLDFVSVLDKRKNDNSNIFELLRIVEKIIIENKINDSDVFRKYHIKDIDKNLRIAFSDTEKFINFSKEYEQSKNNPDFSLKDLIGKYDICPNCIDEFYNGESDDEYQEIKSEEYFNYSNLMTEYDRDFEREFEKTRTKLIDIAKQEFIEKKKVFPNFVNINGDNDLNLNTYYLIYKLINMDMGIVVNIGCTEIEKDRINKEYIEQKIFVNSVLNLDMFNNLEHIETSSIKYKENSLEKQIYYDVTGYYVVNYQFNSSRKNSSFYFKDYPNALDYFLNIKDLKQAIHHKDIHKFVDKNLRKKDPF